MWVVNNALYIQQKERGYNINKKKNIITCWRGNGAFVGGKAIESLLNHQTYLSWAEKTQW